MGTPVASPFDLGVYLEEDDLNTQRATQILQLAQAKCERFLRRLGVNQLDPDAKDIVLSVAARAYNNVTSAHQTGIGSASMSYGAPNSSVGIGGLFLSRSDKSELRRLAGRTGAFSVSMLDPTQYPPPTS